MKKIMFLLLLVVFALSLSGCFLFIAGAAGGAYVGNQVQKSMQKSDVATTTKRVCKTVYDKSQKVVGYDVTYRLEGKEGVVRTSFKPGATLPVKNGQVVVTPP